MESCILCKVITINDGEGEEDDKTNESEEEDRVNFLFRILLEIPPIPGINLLVDGNLINADHLVLLKPSLLKWCDQCSIAIQQARKLYQQIMEATQQFRKVQRKIVETLQSCIIDDGSSTSGKTENYKVIWRKLCLLNEGRFNKFEYPFTVQNWVPLVPPAKPMDKKDEQNDWSSSCHGDDDAEDCKIEEDVKSEEDDDKEDVKLEEDKDEVEVPNTNLQNILLIFPENDGNDEEDDDRLSTGQSDNEAKDDDEETIIESNTNYEKDEADADDPLAENSKNQCSNLKLLKSRCEICKKSFNTKASLIAHKKRCPSSPQKIKPKKFTISSKLPSKHKCLDPHCPSSFKQFHDLRRHMKRFHPQLPLPTIKKFSTFHQKYPELYSKIIKNPNTNLFQCPYSNDTNVMDAATTTTGCTVTSKQRRTIENHIHSKHLGQPGMYPCTWGHGCTRSFTFKVNYKSHMDRHKGTPRWKCDQCDKQFYTQNPLVSHKQREHEDGKSRKPFSCEFCGKSFSCRDHLYTHKSTICRFGDSRKKDGGTTAESRERVECEICGKLVLDLKTHKENVHSGEKHMCHLCPKSFKTGALLKMHLKRHGDTSGVQPVAKREFQCGVKGCRLRFGRAELLESHMIRRHGEDGKKEPELKCQYCGKGFYLRKNLKHHEETHENEGKDPFGCKECGKGFRTLLHLKYHQKHTHKMKLEDRRKVVNR